VSYIVTYMRTLLTLKYV